MCFPSAPLYTGLFQEIIRLLEGVFARPFSERNVSNFKALAIIQAKHLFTAYFDPKSESRDQRSARLEKEAENSAISATETNGGLGEESVNGREYTAVEVNRESTGSK